MYVLQALREALTLEVGELQGSVESLEAQLKEVSPQAAVIGLKSRSTAEGGAPTSSRHWSKIQ